MRSAAIFVAGLALFIAIVAPYAWLVISSISHASELTSVPPHWIPHRPTLEKFIQMFTPDIRGISETAAMFKYAMLNSAIVAIFVTIITLIAASLAAYAFARLTFPGRDQLLLGIVAVRMLPAISIMIALYVTLTKLGLLDTKLGLVLLYLSFTLPFAIWIMTGFFKTIPVELEEAARIDGASRLGALFHIVLPLSAPGLVSTGIFVFMASWDEFFYPLIFTSTYLAKPVPVAITEFAGRHAIDYPAMAAGGVLASIPPLVLAFIFQRYIISGLTAGGVKG
ncbi:MAG TPA: carbohydrate ABC transporter permease [Firmicutes bacterium]|nr:carbohydrate ABC transporter permease [Bacillota bacterium]